MEIYINTYLEGITSLGEVKSLTPKRAVDGKYIIIGVG